MLSVYFKYVPCPVCGENKTVKHFKMNYHFEENQLVIHKDILEEFKRQAVMVKCKHCSHIFVQPQLEKDILNKYYSVQDNNYYKNIGADDLILYSTRNLKIIRQIEGIINGGRLLEIGCGTGNFIRYLSEKWEIFGIDPSKWAVEELQKQGIKGNFFAGIFEDRIYPKDFFDVAVLIDVIEHIQEPAEFIAAVRKCLRPGGIVVILTGNSKSVSAELLKSYWDYLISLEHCSVFNKYSLWHLLEKNRFEIIGSYRITHKNMKKTLQLQYYNLKVIVRMIIKKVLNRTIRKAFFSGFSDHFIVYAKKI